jgi:polygalacturonase
MNEPRTRREVIRAIAAGAAVIAVPGLTLGCRTGGTIRQSGAARGSASGWDLVPEILARIKPPVFPSRSFDVTRYGAVGDGRTDSSSAVARAIDECARSGGGRVVVPSGRFLTGPVTLLSNVELHLQRGATLAFVTDPARYLPPVFTRFEGVELMSYSPFIRALDQTNVAITGEGTLDGQSNNTHWWPWNGKTEYGWTTGSPMQKAARDRLIAMAEDNTPVARRVFGEGSYLRPNFIQPYRCKNVLIEGVAIVNSPMWEIHPVLCENVSVRSVRIDSHGPNNDGCNPESCRDVLIEGCTFDTGDDCIAIKSGRNGDGRRINVPSENIIVRNCVMKDGHGGVTVGSEISGGCRNVFAYDCRMDSPRLDRALRLKNNAMRGGVLEHIYMRDVTVGEVADAVLSIDFYYEEGENGPHTPIARDIEMRRVTSRKSAYGVYLRGFTRAHVGDVRVIDCRFENVAKGNMVKDVDRIDWSGTTVNGERAS